jgi:uncharacterized zinc-type alcohol dehydrogenase-like protein
MTFDLIINSVTSDDMDLNPILVLMKLDGTIVNVGAPEKPLSLNVLSILLMRRNIAGSVIGSIKETQEMLNFCAEH